MLARLERRDVDVLIGTHRLLSKDVKFPDLRARRDRRAPFRRRAEGRSASSTRTVDVLAMTATPIPRTLTLSLAGARDMSVIETPPQNRPAGAHRGARVRPETITDAILREIDRGGQVFFVHNRVETITTTRRRCCSSWSRRCPSASATAR